ncbi:MAG: methyltransferase domain-containing protein [Candidatus Aenigmarchaeota archaeon]|nr:methyltransferase domain-containing protein [Candidatus Aenigmarchaeota archaeon]
MKNIKSWKKEEAAAFEGWDFSHLKNRTAEEKPPWDYAGLARNLVKNSGAVLDMGTGGGEVFSSFAPFRKAVATEGYRPNYLLARKRLGPLGVKVVYFANSTTRKLPFKNGEFDLVLNRHDAFNITEIFRILEDGGIFLTEQVGKNNLTDLMRFFNARPQFNVASFQRVRKGLKGAGFKIRFAENWEGKIEFKDVGAVVYFLKNIPWVVKDFSVDRHMEYLLKLQKKLENGKKLVFKENSYLIQAEKP